MTDSTDSNLKIIHCTQCGMRIDVKQDYQVKGNEICGMCFDEY